MSKVTIKTGTEQEFFARGRRLAQAADRGETLPNEHIVSFEDPADMVLPGHGLMKEIRACAQRFTLQADVA